jgi:V/A-type H+-transporting ATPase subunit C
MADYDYGNARLRVMKSRLLSQRELESLIMTGNLQGLIVALSKTVYQPAIEAALTRASGMQCMDDALRNDLIDSISKMRAFYQEEAAQRVAIRLRAYDIHNLKAILRGLSNHVPANEIMGTLLPIGDLDAGVLRELTGLINPREVIDQLASIGSQYASPLLNVRAESPKAGTPEMELALDKWYFQEASQLLRSETGGADTLSVALMQEADLINLLTVLRLAQHVQEILGTLEMTHLLLHPGRIADDLLVNASSQDSVAAAIEMLSASAFRPALHAGLQEYMRSNRLSDIEKQLKRFHLKWLAGQITRDTLGIGVVLGYIALKVNEISNLRWITLGINQGLQPAAIRAGLELVA